MSTTSYDKLLAETNDTLRVWESHPELKLNNMTLEGFQKTQKNFGKLLDDIKSMESQLGAMVAQRDDAAQEVNELITRTRSAVRGFFGPDSPEYAQLGCTRTSDRKRPARRMNGTTVATVTNSVAEPAVKELAVT